MIFGLVVSHANMQTVVAADFSMFTSNNVYCFAKGIVIRSYFLSVNRNL